MLVAYTAKYDTVLIDSLPSVKCQEGSSKWSQVLKRHWTVQNAFIHAMNFQYINKFYTYRICYWAIRQMSMKLNLGKCSTHNLCIVDLCSETSKKKEITQHLVKIISWGITTQTVDCTTRFSIVQSVINNIISYWSIWLFNYNLFAHQHIIILYIILYIYINLICIIFLIYMQKNK